MVRYSHRHPTVGVFLPFPWHLSITACLSFTIIPTIIARCAHSVLSIREQRRKKISLNVDVTQATFYITCKADLRPPPYRFRHLAAVSVPNYLQWNKEKKSKIIHCQGEGWSEQFPVTVIDSNYLSPRLVSFFFVFFLVLARARSSGNSINAIIYRNG